MDGLDRMRIASILLAAGESTRMGSFKPLLPWGDSTLFEYQVSQLAAVTAELVVVLGHRADDLLPLLPAGTGAASSAGSLVRRRGACPPAPAGPRMAVRAVINADYRLGKTSSIRAGVAALSEDVDAVLVLGVDQPRPAALLESLIREHAASGTVITVPVYGVRSGHPPIFDRSLFGELGALSEEREGLREILRRRSGQVHEAVVDSPAVLLNLNSPRDYRGGKRLFFANRT